MKKSIPIIILLVIIIIILLVLLIKKDRAFIRFQTASNPVITSTTNSAVAPTLSSTNIMLYGSIPLTLPAGWTYREDTYQSPGMQSQNMPPETVGYTFYLIGTDPNTKESIIMGGRPFPGCAVVNAPLCNDEALLLSMGTSLRTKTAFESIRAQISYEFQDFSGQ